MAPLAVRWRCFCTRAMRAWVRAALVGDCGARKGETIIMIAALTAGACASGLTRTSATVLRPPPGGGGGVGRAIGHRVRVRDLMR